MGAAIKSIFAYSALSIVLIIGLSGCLGISNTNRPITEESSQPNSEPIETESDDQSTDFIEESGDAIAQEVDFQITGGCFDSYEELGYYAIFEEFDDDCYLIVEVFPPESSRYASLQYFDETWVEESSGETDSGGIVYLKVDTICDDGIWCDGVWEYRVAIESTNQLPAERSPVFELEFIPWD